MLKEAVGRALEAVGMSSSFITKGLGEVLSLKKRSPNINNF